MSIRPLFSVTKDDFEMQVFRSGGKGGQNQNKVSSGVRLLHKDSGARGECRNHRDQPSNKKEAFKRLLASPEWAAWHRAEVSRRLGHASAAEKSADADMAESNLKIEVLGSKGWEVS